MKKTIPFLLAAAVLTACGPSDTEAARECTR